jgi:TonB family protein
MIAALCVSAVVAEAARGWAADETPAEALRNLITMVLTAARQGDQAKLEEIAHGLVIPNYETWFKTTFGEEEGAKLAEAYARTVDRDKKDFPRQLQVMAEHESEVLIEDAKEPKNPAGNYCGQELLKSVKNDASFYQVSLQWADSSGATKWFGFGHFTLVDGEYRRLNCASLVLFMGRLRVGGNVQSAKVIKKVPPVYPIEARQAGVSGTVRLHVILAKDGTVQQLELVSGHPMLAQAAIDAVRQWTYQPTLLNGFPVEVDTIIDVIFNLNRRPPQRP